MPEEWLGTSILYFVIWRDTAVQSLTKALSLSLKRARTNIRSKLWYNIKASNIHIGSIVGINDSIQ